MSEERIERIFKYIDVAKIILYFLVAGIVSATAWCVKIQMQTNENKSDIEGLHIEKRLTRLETDGEWLKDAVRKVR